MEFGTNLDLSDENLWKEELDELAKLPFWLQVKNKRNILNYVGQDVYGVNTVQTYIKVPGSRTPGTLDILIVKNFFRQNFFVK